MVAHLGAVLKFLSLSSPNMAPGSGMNWKLAVTYNSDQEFDRLSVLDCFFVLQLSEECFNLEPSSEVPQKITS